jgi:hypothetical protein
MPPSALGGDRLPPVRWMVTTEGELADEHEVRQHDGAARAWDDY